VYGQMQAGAVAGLGQYGWDRRVGVAAYATAFYLYKTVLPFDLSPLYPMTRHFSLYSWPYLLSGGVLLALSVGAVHMQRRWPAGLALWLGYLVMLAPVSGVTQMGPQVAADRYTYLPCLGWALLGGWCVFWLSRHRSRRLIAQAGAALVILILAALTWRQCKIWHDSVSLWEHAGGIYPGSHLVHQNWGAAFAEVGDHKRSLEHCRESARLLPESPEAQNNIGTALTHLGLPAKAEPHLRRAIELKPTHGAAHYNLANVLVQLGKLQDAVHHYELALKHRPDLVGARVNLANVLSRMKRQKEAEKHWAKAIEQDPGIASAYGNWAAALTESRRYAEAVEVLRRGAQNCPGESRLRLNWLWLLAAAPDDAARNGDEAVRQAERLALSTGQRDPVVLDVLAAAYAEVGRYEDAVAQATRAAELAALSRDRALLQQINKNLGLYRQRRPVRLP
jgi:protein O-mannosyl-transferase